MTVREVAEILECSTQRVHQLIKAKRLWARVWRDSGGRKHYDVRDAIPRPPLRKYTKPKLRELQGRGKP